MLPDIIHIRDVLHGNRNTTLMHVFREQNMCADFIAKEESYARCSVQWNFHLPHMEYLIRELGT